LQYYREENMQVSDGTLKIIAKQEAYGIKPHTSARIRRFGKVEFDLTQLRAEIPVARKSTIQMAIIEVAKSSIFQ
jgi:hypothetical protein